MMTQKEIKLITNSYYSACFSHLATPQPAVFLAAKEVTPPGTVKVSWEDVRQGRLIEVEYTILYHKDGENQNQVKTTLVHVCTCSLELV